MRDICFMIPDLMHFCFPFLQLRKVARMRGGIIPRPTPLIATCDLIVAGCSVFGLWLFCALVVKQ